MEVIEPLARPAQPFNIPPAPTIDTLVSLQQQKQHRRFESSGTTICILIQKYRGFDSRRHYPGGTQATLSLPLTRRTASHLEVPSVQLSLTYRCVRKVVTNSLLLPSALDASASER